MAGEQVLAPGERALIATGVRIALPPGYEAQVRPRSGLALEHGLMLPNAPGTVDSDYRGELKVIVWNSGSEPYVIRRGDRIAQLVVQRVERLRWVAGTRERRISPSAPASARQPLDPTRTTQAPPSPPTKKNASTPAPRAPEAAERAHSAAVARRSASAGSGARTSGTAPRRR